MIESGFLVLDKPEGISSAKLVARVKKLLGVAKAGHAGTLDPFATGVMICCINQATRLSRFFLHGTKTYDAVICLGIETDTQDVTGNIISQADLREMKIEADVIRAVCRQFEGNIEQMPPVYSALKHEGVPLYRLARKGKPVQKPARHCFISSLDIREINRSEIHVTVACSAGTYIRSLAADIGKALGCGAHLKALRRIESGGFTIQQAVTLEELERDLTTFGKLSNLRMTEMADALHGMSCHVADEILKEKIKCGVPLAKKEIPPLMLNRFYKIRHFGTPDSLSGQEPERFIKIVDTDHRLLAVISDKKELDIYNYCCVFQ